jgi:hypothetical protein
MRYRVQLRIREDTGEVELFQVDTVDADPRAAGHDAAHNRVTAEVAGLLENDAIIDEVAPAHIIRQPTMYTPQAEPEPPRQLPETHGA